MMNSKKKALTVLSLAFALSLATTGAVYGVTASADGEPFAIDAGASIKVVGTTDESAVETDTGIRFKATVTPEFVSTLGDNDYVGMMIVPSKVITAYNNQDGEVEEDYLQFIADKKGVAKSTVENDVACKYEKADLSTADNTTVYGVIASVKDDHYDDDYQAVAYYVKDGVYTYIGASGASTIVDVANSALLDTEFPYTVEDKRALGNILEKSVVVNNALTLNDGVYELTLTDTDTVDLQSEFGFAGDDLANIGLAVEKGNTDFLNSFITYDETAKTLKSSMTGEWLKATVTAYDGNVSLPLAISYEPTTKDVTFTITNAEQAEEKTLSTYGASEFDSKTGAVKLLAGSYSGTGVTDFGTTNIPYVALDGAYGENSYVVVDFKGNNIPNVAFYTDSPSNDTKNLVGANGFMFSNASFGKRDGTFGGSSKLYGRMNVYASAIFNKADGTSVGSNANPLGYFNASDYIKGATLDANPDKEYRLIVYVIAPSTAGQYPYRGTYALLEKNTEYDGAEGTYEWNYLVGQTGKNFGTKDTNNGYSQPTGGIIIYGTTYRTVELDAMQIVVGESTSWGNNQLKAWSGEGLW